MIYAEAERLAERIIDDPHELDQLELDALFGISLIRKEGRACKGGIQRGKLAILAVVALARRLQKDRRK